MGNAEGMGLPFAMNPTELKHQIVQKGVEKLLDDEKVPFRYFTQVVAALHKSWKSHKADLDTHKTFQDAHARQIQDWDLAAKHLQSLPHIKGEVGQSGRAGIDGKNGKDGADGIAPSIKEIVDAVRPLIRMPKDGKNGANAAFDEDKFIEKMINKLRTDKPLDISHIRNAQTFIKDGVRYKVEELMRGASGGSSSSTPLTPTGTVNGVNQVFGVTSSPSSVVSDGITYFLGAGYSYSTGNITLDVPPSSYVRFYA